MRLFTVALSLALSSSLGLVGCGGCYDAFAFDVLVEGDGPATECIEARRGPPLNSCGPTGGIVIDNRCDAPLVFADPAAAPVAAGALGVVVTWDAATYDYDTELYTLDGAVDGEPVAVTWFVD